MEAIESFFMVFLNVLPIIVLIIPLFFLWKKIIGKLYFRVTLGIIVFYLIYWVLPIIFQVGETPNELVILPSEEGNIAYGIGYIFAHFGSLIIQFFSYPIITLPFIFFIAPFISLLFFWNHLRKEEGTLSSNLSQVSYEIKESPLERVKNELKINDWSREKEILKLMIVLLPISLYFLQVILEISKLQNEALTTGETALGWFLEILFVYIAIFIFSIELLFSSQVALKGRFFGEQLRDQIYKSLYTIGVPMSIFSIILFAIHYETSMVIILYFFAYFIMASIIFILFLDIFEPISILIFIKIINWWKNRKQNKIKTQNFYYIIIFGALGLIIYFISTLILTSFVYTPIFGEPGSLEETRIYVAGEYTTKNPELSHILLFDLLIIYGILVTEIIPIIILTLFLVYGFKYLRSIGVGIVVYFPIILTLSILLIIGSGDIYWLTGQTSYTRIFGFDFYTLRTASLKANLPELMNILAAPYLYTRYSFNIILWSLLIYYFRKEFRIKNIPLDEENIEKIVFSSVNGFLSYEDYTESYEDYLVTKKENVDIKSIDQEREEIKALINTIGTDRLLKEIKPIDINEEKRFYFTLRYLYQKNFIDFWRSELSYIYERVEKQGLYIIYEDGRGVYNYTFQKDIDQDPGLVSGMFSAITAFVKEMTKSTEALKKIDHGDITILLEYGTKIFGALFIKGTQSSEVRMPLKEIVQKFEEKYKNVLKDWTGSLTQFNSEEDKKLVEEIFKKE
ncbi:MAG: hypothetical protein ACFFHD_08090 [Promethearchaeota archaeon]